VRRIFGSDASASLKLGFCEIKVSILPKVKIYKTKVLPPYKALDFSLLLKKALCSMLLALIF